MKNQAQAIQHFILTSVDTHPKNIVAVTANRFEVTRTTVHRHLRHLIKQGLIYQTGTTRNTRYQLKSSYDRTITYQIKPGLSEFSVLKIDFKEIFERFPQNLHDVFVYAFTEMFNNAIDHSQGTRIVVSTRLIKARLQLVIEDNGIGLFKNIFDYFRLNSLRESVLQLSKGKLTTDPANHSGEGIFFTSRAFEQFEIYANQMHYFRNNNELDWGVETIHESMTGTKIVMESSKNAEINLVELFKRYQSGDNLSFDRTEILVKLSKIGEELLISRSQAKRMTLGLEKFNHITLDFSGVRLVGQGFVDEVFRVFSQAHPHISITHIHANEDVMFMIQRSAKAIES